MLNPQPTIEHMLDDQSKMIGQMYEHFLDMPLSRMEETMEELQNMRARVVATEQYTATLPFLQYILDLFFKQFKLSEDVVNRILQLILDLQCFKSSPFNLCSNYSSKLFNNTSYQQHLNSCIDYMYIKSYSFRLFSSLPAINSGVVSPLATRKVHVHGRLKTISTLTVCSELVNPLAPRKRKFHGGLITISTLCT
ncbi:hypothetical protein Tco_1433421 [Tanacetum coccineum]